MDCAIAIFCGRGLISLISYVLFIAQITFLVVFYYSLKDAKREIRAMREKLEDLVEEK